MKSELPQVDVAIIGAGTTGAATALLCARRGMSVLCLERGDLAHAGAHWVNGVPAWAFDEAGIERPKAPELLAGGADFHLIAGWGPERLILRQDGLLEVDMRRLVERLQGEARAAGAIFSGNTRVEDFDGATLSTSKGPAAARWIVDASGLSGARLLDHPRPDAADICAAAQQVLEVLDPGAARRFCEEHGASVGDTICFSGIEGGYSILNIRVESGEESGDESGQQDRVAILTGTIPARGHRSGRALLREFVAEQPWIGEPIFGGSRAIPLRRPYARLHRGSVAVVGDAACQVFAAHGSGIGPGLVAARILADALADGRGLDGYERDWQRDFGGLFAGYAVFREFVQTLTPADLSRMISCGLMDSQTVADGLLQRMPRASARMLLAKLRAVLRAPDLAVQLAPVMGGMAAANLLYAGYPAAQSRRAGWSKLVDRVLGAQA
jgi:flavin-dependent dehydrogenase